jgi:predicted ATPase/DNA-binding SARP family transcriptional activator
MQVRVLGPLELVSDGGDAVALASPKLRRLLAALVVQADAVVSADQLADVVWGDEPPANATGALHNLVSRLRGRLRSGAAGDDHPLTLDTQAPGYVLTLDADTLDAALFIRLVDQARACLDTDAAAAAGMLDRALTLWRGDAYAEFRDEPFARAEAARLTELRVTAVEERISAALALGRSDDAIARLELLIGAHPLRERPRGLLMVALYRAGRQADALAAYQRYRALLDTELGLAPSAELRALEQRILRNDPALGGTSVAPELAVRPRWSDGTPSTVPSSAGPAPRSTAPARLPAPPPAPPTTAPVPGRSSSAVVSGVPTTPELLGRDRLIAQVCDASRSGAGPVTLIGPGGVGKTSVATRVAAVLAADDRDGPWWCELASVDRDGAVADVVMTELQANPRQGMTTVEAVVDVLRPRRGLLLLDNAEHVVDGVAKLVSAITGGCAGIAVVTTSRERIGVVREQVIAVPPLDLPARDVPAADLLAARDATGGGVGPAVELFTRRAAAASGFTLTSDNLPQVAEICRRLDGVPLALELAATRMRSMTPADLLERLSWRFRVLRGGRRTGAARHRTLRAVVDWSYDLLDEDSRLVFDSLSVFAGTFTLDAAEQVVATAGDGVDAHDVADVIARLVDASMVVAHTTDDIVSYALLDTLRDYGREQLEVRGEAHAARRAHAMYYIELAERVTARLFDPDSALRVMALDHAVDELRAAHSWSMAHDLGLALQLVAALPPYAEHRALGEAFAWAERAVEAADRAGVDSPHLAGAYGAAALSARFRGDLKTAASLAARAVADGPADRTSFVARYTLSEVALYEGRLDDVLRLADELEDVPTDGTDAVFVIWIRASRVLALAYQGHTDAAIAEAERFLEAGRRQEGPMTIAWASYVLAETLVEDDPTRALPLAEEALAHSRQLDDRFLTGVALVTAASLQARHGDAVRAVELFQETVDRWHRAGNWTQQWVAVRSIVGLLLRLHAYDDAAVLLGVLDTRTTAPEPFGADAQRLAVARGELVDRLGDERMAAAHARAAVLRDDDAIAWIRDVLDGLGADTGDGHTTAGGL